MLINKNLFNKNPLLKKFLDDINSELSVKSVIKDNDNIVIKFKLIPPHSEIKFSSPFIIPFIIDTDNNLCQPIISLPKPENIFGDSMSKFSNKKYDDIIRKTLSNPEYDVFLPFLEENIPQIKEFIANYLVSMYEEYKNNLSQAIDTTIKDNSERFYIIKNVEHPTKDDFISSGLPSLEDAKKKLMDYMISFPSSDLTICDTHNSDDSSKWEIF